MDYVLVVNFAYSLRILIQTEEYSDIFSDYPRGRGP